MILDEIVAKTKVRLEENKKKLPPEELQKQALSMAAESSGRKSTTAAFLSGSPEKTGHVLHL